MVLGTSVEFAGNPIPPIALLVIVAWLLAPVLRWLYRQWRLHLLNRRLQLASTFGATVAKGERHGIPVWVHLPRPNKENPNKFEVLVGPYRSFQARFCLLSRHDLFSALRHANLLQSGVEEVTGDYELDSRVTVDLPNGQSLAAFDEENRKRLIKLSRWKLRVTHEEIAIYSNWPIGNAGLIELIETAVSLAKDLTDGDLLQERFFRICTSDPCLALREKSLPIFNEICEDQARKQVLYTNLVESGPWTLAARAACYLGKPGIDALEKRLGRSTARISEDCFVILEEDGSAEAIALLKRYVRSSPAAVRSVVKQEGEAAFDLLLEIALDPVSQEHLRAVLKALDVFADPRALPTLLRLLSPGRHLDNTSITQCLALIGKIGDVSTISRLEQLEERAKLSLQRRAARKAIESIQNRLQPGEDGWLSISETEAQEGALELVSDSEHGALELSVGVKDGGLEVVEEVDGGTVEKGQEIRNGALEEARASEARQGEQGQGEEDGRAKASALEQRALERS